MPTSKQRRDAERRRLQRQVQRRAQREARRRRSMMLISVLGTLIVIAIVITVIVMSGNDHKTPAASKKTTPHSTAPTSPSSSTTPPPYPCTWTTSGKAAKPVSVPPTTTPPKTGSADILVQTSRGPMTFALNRAAAPCAVESFVSLAEQNYFNATSCHRLVTKGIFVLQCGDPTGTGSGGPGYSFGDELTGKEKYTRGVLAMANAGPNTNGSQFFIVYKKSPLPPSYTIFGRVTSGLPIVDKVARGGATGTTGDGKPKLAIKLQSVRVVQ